MVAFRGTQEPKDWITNLTFKMVPATQGKVHEGFNHAVDSVWNELLHEGMVLIAPHTLGFSSDIRAC